MNKPVRELAAQIVGDAGGRIVGRTRFQKVAFLLELTGLGDGFHFEYKHYGPYSDELATAVSSATAFGLVNVDEHQTSWGGWYSTYTTGSRGDSGSAARRALATEAAALDSVTLELAATAAYLRVFEGYANPWYETERRKPEKATTGGIDRAKQAYRRLMAVKTPRPLPDIV